MIVKTDPYKRIRREIAPPGHVWVNEKAYRRDVEKEMVEKEVIDGIEEYVVENEDLLEM